METEINKNILKIKIKNKINEMSEEEMIELFSLISAFKIEEKRKGNEYDKAWLKIKYVKNLVITEHINVFNLIRLPNLYEFIKYFINIEKKFDSQNTETKALVNDYFEKTENISQEIIIIMVFDIESSLSNIDSKKIMIAKSLKIGETWKDLFEMLKDKN
jgi:hypothetical protein